MLGYEKPRNAIAAHVDADDALKWGLTDSLGRTQETTIINESGLYSLILSSKLPGANNKNGRLKGLFILAPQQNRNDHGTRRKQFDFQAISIYGK